MINLEKLEQDWTDGKAVNPRNVRLLLDEVKRLQSQWIPASERLPDHNDWVIAYSPLAYRGQPAPATYWGICWYDKMGDMWYKNAPTHWQEMPPPPVITEERHEGQLDNPHIRNR